MFVKHIEIKCNVIKSVCIRFRRVLQITTIEADLPVTETALFFGTREKKDSPKSHTEVSALSALCKDPLCFQTL